MPVLKSVNPYSPGRIINYPEISEMNLIVLVGRAQTAFNQYKKTTFAQRKQWMLNLTGLLKERNRNLAEMITTEMGKPLKESIAEVKKCAWVCEFYADQAAGFLKKKSIKTEAGSSYVCYQPLGPILAIMPWNFPFWQVFRFSAPALMAGNTALLKHASNVQGCAQAIESLFRDAGFEEGVFQNLSIGSDRVSEVIEHEYVRAVTLTGSEQAGVSVAVSAGWNIKKCVLELGGNNAFVVLNDADLNLALETAITARLQNGGQSCIAAKRFILESWIAEDFVPQLTKRVEQITMGDPMAEETDLGPLSSVQQAQEVERQVKESVEKGARLISGGHRMESFYEPTILTNVQPGMPAFDEEVFGPVFAITEVSSPEQALELSNQSRFGLGVQVFTNSKRLAALFIDGAQEGAVFINAMVKSDPRLPFGGVKKSGYGRELSVDGIREFVNIKTVWID